MYRCAVVKLCLYTAGVVACKVVAARRPVLKVAYDESRSVRRKSYQSTVVGTTLRRRRVVPYDSLTC